jgi:hypothetical protein
MCSGRPASRPPPNASPPRLKAAVLHTGESGSVLLECSQDSRVSSRFRKMRKTASLIGTIVISALSGCLSVQAQDAFDSSGPVQAGCETQKSGAAQPAAAPAGKSAAPAAITGSSRPAARSAGGMDVSSYNAMADHVNRGLRLMRGGSLQAALSEFEAAKAIDPNNNIVRQNLAECHNHMGYELFRRKSYPDAAAEFEKCMAIYPGHQAARRNIGLCKAAMTREGYQEKAAEPDEQPDKKSKEPGADKDSSARAEKEDTSPRVVGTSGSSSSVTPGAAVFVSGSQMFPVYTNNPSAASMQVKPTILNKEPAKSTPAASNPAAGSTVPNASPLPAGNTIRPAAVAASGGSGPFENPAGYVPAAAAPAAPATASSAGSVPVPAAAPFSQASQNPVINASQAAAPALPPPTNSSGPGLIAGGDGQTTEDKVSALEIKVYGRKNSQLALMKRIEQLEIDQFGQVRQGTMPERVESLKKAIGLN